MSPASLPRCGRKQGASAINRVHGDHALKSHAILWTAKSCDRRSCLKALFVLDYSDVAPVCTLLPLNSIKTMRDDCGSSHRLVYGLSVDRNDGELANEQT